MKKISICLCLLLLLSGCRAKVSAEPESFPTVSAPAETVPSTETEPTADSTEAETEASTFRESEFPESTPPIVAETLPPTVPNPSPTAAAAPVDTNPPTAPEGTDPESVSTEEPISEIVWNPEPQSSDASGLQQTTLSLSDGTEVRCWLYIPAAPDPNPGLIVYLHGGSGKGNDLNKITEVDGFPQYLQSGSLGILSCYVLIPQLPASCKGWSDWDSTVMSMIQSVTSQYGIDASRISLTGHSMGGTGAWSFAAAHPGFFARVAPLSGSIRCTEEGVQALKDTPIHAFTGAADTIVKPESSEAMIHALVSAGGDARLTEIPDADHFSVPALAYLGDYGLLDWLQGN